MLVAVLKLNISVRGAMDNAADSDSEDWGFESLRAGQNIQVFGLDFFIYVRMT